MEMLQMRVCFSPARLASLEERKTGSYRMIRDFAVGSILPVGSHSKIYTESKFRKGEGVFLSEQFAFPPLRVIRERIDEYKDVNLSCRVMCSLIYHIELDRSIMNIGHLDKPSLTVLEWKTKKKLLGQARTRSLRAALVDW